MLAEDGFVEIEMKVSGIYALVRDGEVVYVGKSKDIYGRFAKHDRGGKRIQFDSVWIKRCPKKDLDRLERQYIRKYMPKQNVTYKPIPWKPAKTTESVVEIHGIEIKIRPKGASKLGTAAKMTVEQALEVKRLIGLGMGDIDISKDLEYCSPMTVYAIRKGKTWTWLHDKDSKPARNSRVHSTKLIEDDVHKIRHLLSDGSLTLKEIGATFGVSDACIGNIKRGTTWGWLTPKIAS